jgi:uncharacterized lipoprotein YmbA
LVLLVLNSVVAACISSPEPATYVLSHAVDFTMETDSASGPVVQLRRVLVPDYLDTTDILERVGQYRLKSSSTGRWGERLSLGMTHALGSDLAIGLPTNRVTFGHPAEKSVRQIVVSVDRFDVWGDGHCVLTANWSILESHSGAVLTEGRGKFVTTPVRNATPGDGAVVAGMADAVSQLADSITLAFKGLPPQSNMHGAEPPRQNQACAGAAVSAGARVPSPACAHRTAA